MRTHTIEVDYDDHIYEVKFEYSLGNIGTYFDPPETHNVELLEVYDEYGELVTDNKILNYIDQEVYDFVDYYLY